MRAWVVITREDWDAMQAADRKRRVASLGPRELRMALGLVSGRALEGVALDMGVDAHTSRSLRGHVSSKLGCDVDGFWRFLTELKERVERTGPGA